MRNANAHLSAISTLMLHSNYSTYELYLNHMGLIKEIKFKNESRTTDTSSHL